MMSINTTYTGLNPRYCATALGKTTTSPQKATQEKQSPLLLPSIQPRQSTEVTGDELVQQALTLIQPNRVLDEGDLDYRAPLVDFLASPEAIQKQALKLGAMIGTGVGAVLGGITLAGLATVTDNKIGFVKGAGFLALGAGVGVLLGGLCGWASGSEAAKNQAWVNKNMFEMMDLTSPTATLGEGNKALKKETGDSFSHRLGRVEARKRDERTQQLILENQLLTLGDY